MDSTGFEGGLREGGGPGGLAGCSFGTVVSSSATTGPVSDSEGFSITGLSEPPSIEGLGDVLGCIISGADSLPIGSCNTYINDVIYEIITNLTAFRQQ